jgi:cytochrome bd ubiquinol oxidase subunit I
VLVVTFTWLMGLMGFARSGIRQHWHIWEVMRDTSPYAATPALGYAAIIISVCVVIFLGMISFIFWLGGLVEKPQLVPDHPDLPPTPGRTPLPVPAGGD